LPEIGAVIAISLDREHNPITGLHSTETAPTPAIKQMTCTSASTRFGR